MASGVSTYVVENDKLVRPSTLVVADSEEKPLPCNDGNQLLSEQSEETSADGCEVEVVHLEQEVEFERFPVAHKLPTAEDYNVVCDKRNYADFECRQRCLSLYESEVLRLVPGDGLEALFKDGPEGQAKGTVKRRRTDIEPFWLAHCVCERLRGSRRR